MYSLLAIVLTFGELLIVGLTYLMGAENTFYMVLVYGGPFFLLRSTVQAGFLSAISTPWMLMGLSFHIFKYFFIIRAYSLDQRNPFWKIATLFELIYLGLSWHYLPA